jgi:lactate dehydrogenase-like 2-hydroxyacid dehydrogenase
MTETRPTLLLTKDLPPAIRTRAESAFLIRMPGPLKLKDWLAAERATGAEALLCIPGFRFDAAAISMLPQSIRVIGTFSVGTDHIDLEAARARGIAVVNTPDVVSVPTAEFTMGLILAAARRMGEAERLVRAGRWQGWTPADFLGTDVSGKRLGIFGMGRIGRCLARIASGGFGMQVHYRNRTRLPAQLEAGATYHEEDASFLAACQVLCLLAPGGPSTERWLNAARLAALPRGAIVVNTARGTLVDDDALAAALHAGHVAAAALDVFPREPAVPEVYLGLENVVLTPHIATATTETRDAMGNLVLDGILGVLAGREVPNRVA